VAPTTFPLDKRYALPNVVQFVRDAKCAIDAQHSQTAWNAIRAYPMTTFFLVFLSLSLVMKGYDIPLTGTFFGLPQFLRAIGTRIGSTDDFQISSSWQSAFFNASQAGEIFGLAIAGRMADRIGYRKTLIGAHLLVLYFLFLFVFAKSRAMLLFGGILCGIPWVSRAALSISPTRQAVQAEARPGGFPDDHNHVCVGRDAHCPQTGTYDCDVCLAPGDLTYHGEFLTSNQFAHLCWLLGQLLAVGVLRGTFDIVDWAWRLP
jgi:hypothetical protein